MRNFSRTVALASVILLTCLSSPRASTVIPEPALPRFTEEREAAALFFLRKNAPDLLTVLEQMRRDNSSSYRREICAVFQVTEMLADLQDEPRRHDLELEIWRVESKARALAARLPALGEGERRKADSELQRLARDLVELDIQVLELKAEETEKELGEIRDDLAKARNQIQSRAKTRYDRLLEQGRKRRKTG